MDITATELQNKTKRERFVESRLEELGVPKSNKERDVCLRAAVKQEYSKQINDELSHSDSLLYGDSDNFEYAIGQIEAYMVNFVAGYEAGWNVAASQN